MYESTSKRFLCMAYQHQIEKCLFLCVFYLLLMVVMVDAEDGGFSTPCPETSCGHLTIRFPFTLKGTNNSQQCAYPGFDLSCSNHHALLELPISLAKLFVKRIDYKSQEIHLYASDHCLVKQLLNFNISNSPFQYPTYKSESMNNLGNYSLFNCSGEKKGGEISCLSNHDAAVLLVISDYYRDYSKLIGCTRTNLSVTIPYNVYYDRQNVLKLEWETPRCKDCESHGKHCKLKDYNTLNHVPSTECYPKPKRNKHALAITAIILSSLFLLSGISALFYFYRLYRIEKRNQDKVKMFLEDYRALKPTRYSSADLKHITNQFKESLGKGAFGTVFKGKLSTDVLVAVKLLNDSKQNGEEFINEVATIGNIHHVNVVRLVGYCADGFTRALVYEYLPNESLEKFIFYGGEKKQSLGWVKLQDIALGIARGIEYLHQGCDQRILHFDIKPHNVLLDENFNPKISDFGLSKLCSKSQSAVSMTAARGTMGYIAPEVFSRNFGNVSYKSDVYSFGMMLLEIVGGRKNGDATAEKTSQVYFPEWVYTRLEQGEELRIRILEEGDDKIAKKLTIVGLWCIQWYPVDRPTMKNVLQMLEGEGENLTFPPNPFATTGPTNMLRRPHTLELAVISEIE